MDCWPHSQSFRFIWSGEGPKNLNFPQVPRWCCYWSRDHTPVSNWHCLFIWVWPQFKQFSWPLPQVILVRNKCWGKLNQPKPLVIKSISTTLCITTENNQLKTLPRSPGLITLSCTSSHLLRNVKFPPNNSWIQKDRGGPAGNSSLWHHNLIGAHLKQRATWGSKSLCR